MKARLSFAPEIENFPGKILERLLSAKMRKIRKKKKWDFALRVVRGNGSKLIFA